MPDHTDFATEIFDVKVPDVDAIDFDSAIGGLVETQKEVEYGRLPAA